MPWPKMRWLVCFATVLCAAATALAVEHTTDTLDQVKANLAQKKAQIIDVREADEWKTAHLKGALLVPLSRLQAGDEPQTLAKEIDKQKVIYTYCRAGRRAVLAANILKELGYDVRPLKSGCQELLDAGFPAASP